jgi:hypothetical protein
MKKLIGFLAVAITLSGCADMRAVQQVRHENELVMAVVSAPGDVGLVGMASGRSVSGSGREVALKKLVDLHPEWHWDEIEQKKIGIGMTDAEVLMSWGQPYRVNRASYGQQWVYCSGVRMCIPATYVYIDNAGIVTAWN